MREIYLQEAADRIHQMIRQRLDRNRRSPFFFLVGAGISAPPIKLAREIEDECREEAGRWRIADPPDSMSALDRYSYWLSSAHPSSADRRDYLRGLMDHKPVSPANLRLAHLLQEGTVSNTAFTTNFDDLLSKALSLFGQPHVLCDHPLTAGRIAVDSADVQVVHVHGSYWFYDCCNLKGEISERSEDGSMSSLLDGWLREHSPLVVGYGGWEGDVFMKALRRRLESNSGRIGAPLFWFCDRRASLDCLPEWLRKSREATEIYFVVPKLAAQSAMGVAAVEGVTTVRPPQGAAVDASSTPEDSKEPSLASDLVFDTLIQKFRLSAPALVEAPLKFFANKLRDQIQIDGQGSDLYSFQKVVGRIERAGRLLEDNERRENPDPLQALRGAMSRADYHAAVATAKTLDLSELSESDLRLALTTLWEAARSLDGASEDKAAAYDLIAQIGSTLGDQQSIEKVAKSLVNKGFTLGMLNRHDEAIASYSEALQRFGDSPDAALRAPAAKALVNIGAVLGILNRNSEAIEKYSEAVRRYGDSSEPAIRQEVARALVSKGRELDNMRKSEEAIAAYDEVIDRFADSTAAALRPQLAQAFAYKGYLLALLGRNEEAIAACDEVIRRYGESQEVDLREQVVRALINRGFALGKSGQRARELAAYDEFLRLFGDSPDPRLRWPQAVGLLSKGLALRIMGRNGEAIKIFDEVTARYERSTDPLLQEQVAKALVNKGWALATMGRREEQIAAYSEVLRIFGKSREPAIQRQVAWALNYRASALEERARTVEAEADYREIVARFEGDPSHEIVDIVKWARGRLDGRPSAAAAAHA